MGESVGSGAEPAVRRRRRRPWLALVVAVGLLAALALGGLVYGGARIVGNTSRITGVFDGLPARPEAVAGAEGAVDILVVTTDDGPDAPAGARGDMLLLVHLDGDRRGASVVWIPFGTLVEIPGHGRGPVADALALGGPRLLVATVERLTGVRLDHVAVTHLSRLGALADAVGGVTVEMPEPAGRHVLDGAQVLAYLRQGDRPPVGEPDEVEGVERQRAVVRALMTTALQQEMRSRPRVLYRFLDTMTRGLAVDDTMSAWEGAAIVLSMREVRSARIRYLAMPVTRGGEGDAGSALRPAEDARALWRAVAEDRVDTWQARRPG